MSAPSSRDETNFANISELVEELANGRCIILMDDEDRENEGDLVAASSLVTPETVNFMATHGRGLICLTLTEEQCDRLGLPLQQQEGNGLTGTNFTAPIDAAQGVTTGISAEDRCVTIRTAVNGNSGPAQFVKPGHIFPVRAVKGGVLSRAGHTEAGCDLARMAGLEPSSTICEILKPDGSMARGDYLEAFAKEHHLKIGTIADLIRYRNMTEQTIHLKETVPVELPEGSFTLGLWHDNIHDNHHISLSVGGIDNRFDNDEEVTVRVHLPDLVQDLLKLKIYQERWSYSEALVELSKRERGILLLINSDNIIGNIAEQIQSLSTIQQNQSATQLMAATASTNTRYIGIGAQILKAMGAKKISLLGFQSRYPSLSGFGIEVIAVESPQKALR